MLRLLCTLLMLLAGLVSVAEVHADTGAPLAAETAAPGGVTTEAEETSQEEATALALAPMVAPRAHCYGEDQAPALARRAALPAVPPPER